MLHHQFIATILLVVFTVVTANVTAHLEEEARYLIAAQAILQPERPAVLRNSLNICWVAVGAILGGYVAVALRNVTGLHHIVKYYAVSVATALATAPYVLTTWFGPLLSPEACFLVGFLFAVAAWLGWELVGILACRLKRAAAQRGWLGIKDEITGTQSTTQENHPCD